MLHSSPAFAGAGDILCVVIDTQPAVLTGKAREAVHKGLCSVPRVKVLSEDKQKETESVVLFSLAAGNTDAMDKALEIHEATRLLYSVHSAAGSLVTHSVYLYDQAAKATVQGGRTFDRAGNLKNVDKAWAKKSANAALTALASHTLAEAIRSKGGALGESVASIMSHAENPSQFLKARGTYKPEEIDAVEKVIEAEKGTPKASRDYALCALHFLSGRNVEALASFDRFARGGPEPSMTIMRVNLLLAMGRYVEALKSADNGDADLGFDLFFFSRAVAQSGMGEKEKSRELFEEFKTRSGADWERLTMPVVNAAWHTGDEKTLRAFAEPFLAASPSDSSRKLIEQMMKK